jgi:hypothetical protein
VVERLQVALLAAEAFEVIFQRAKNEEWRALGDDFRTLLHVIAPPAQEFRAPIHHL